MSLDDYKVALYRNELSGWGAEVPSLAIQVAATMHWRFPAKRCSRRMAADFPVPTLAFPVTDTGRRKRTQSRTASVALMNPGVLDSNGTSGVAERAPKTRNNSNAAVNIVRPKRTRCLCLFDPKAADTEMVANRP